jgi:N-acetylglucosamine kinase-like BadF-type ATPase
LIAGVDIGGTKTHLMVCWEGGSIVADAVVPTDSWRSREIEADASTLAKLVRQFTQGAEPAALAVGAHGCDTEEHCTEFEACLAIHFRGRMQVVNDSELMVPAAGFLDGIGVVAGTGSIAVARTADRKMLVAGGWGWILGDEGSAPALVREAARAIRGALDARAPADALIEALMREIGTDDPTKLGRLLNETRSAVIWGRYANAVFDAAEAGSPLAARVITEGGSALAGLVGALMKRGADAARVVAGGGVIVEQPLLMLAFKVAMTEISPSSEVVLLRKPPVVGAVALAERLLS